MTTVDLTLSFGPEPAVSAAVHITTRAYSQWHAMRILGAEPTVKSPEFLDSLAWGFQPTPGNTSGKQIQDWTPGGESRYLDNATLFLYVRDPQDSRTLADMVSGVVVRTDGISPCDLTATVVLWRDNRIPTELQEGSA